MRIYLAPVLLPFVLLLQGFQASARPILRGVDKSLTLEIDNNAKTEHPHHPPSSSSSSSSSTSPDAAAAAAILDTPAGAAAAAAAEAQITEGEHCKLHFRWVVSQTQRVSSVRKEGGREGGREGGMDGGERSALGRAA